MSRKTIINALVLSIAILSAIASSIGILSNKNEGSGNIISVRGEKVILYGKGVYHHMSAQVAPQGIAQDYVTLFIALPLLIISLLLNNKGSVRGKILLAGTLGYFLVTYLFFTMMAMYNQLFLLWVVNLALSFYGFILVFTSLNNDEVSFQKELPVKFIGGFLMFCALAITFLWLSVIIPPFLNNSIPAAVEHYTTLVVQALDLSILLPASFISGWLLFTRKSYGYIIAPVYTVFLSILMLALTAKIIAMGILGYNIIPVVYIISTFTIVTIVCLVIVVLKLNNKNYHEITRAF